MVVSGAPRIEIEAEPEEVDISSARLAKLTDVMKRHVEAHDIPGFATLVGRHGKVVQFKTYGITFASREMTLSPGLSSSRTSMR